MCKLLSKAIQFYSLRFGCNNWTIVGYTGILSFCQHSADLSSTPKCTTKEVYNYKYSTDKWTSAIKKIDVWNVLLL